MRFTCVMLQLISFLWFSHTYWYHKYGIVHFVFKWVASHHLYKMMYFCSWRLFFLGKQCKTLIKCRLMQHFIWVFTVLKSTCLLVSKKVRVTYKKHLNDIDKHTFDKNTNILKSKKILTIFALQYLRIFTHILKNQRSNHLFKYLYIFCDSNEIYFVKILFQTSRNWNQNKAIMLRSFEPWHEISNNVVCATSKGSDQPAHTHRLIRAFASRLNILWLISYWLKKIWSNLAK